MAPLTASVELSVIMAVRDGGDHLDPSVHSILTQTYRNFELVVLDNQSTDGSTAKLADWAARDTRVRLVTSPENLGVIVGSNHLVSLARAPVIARMDQDDISHPDRLARQMAVLRDRPDVVLVGTLADGIDATGERVRGRDRSRLVRPATIPFAPFPHGSVMFRREAFERAGGYRDADGWEDLDFFLRLCEQGRIMVLPEALYRYRYHGSVTTTMDVARVAAVRAHREASLHEWKARGRYEHLRPEERPRPSRRQELEALAAHSALQIWAGRPAPATLAKVGAAPGLAWRHRVRLWVMATWGRAHSRSLRRAWAAGVALRDRRAGRSMPASGPVEWLPGVRPSRSAGQPGLEEFPGGP